MGGVWLDKSLAEHHLKAMPFLSVARESAPRNAGLNENVPFF